MRLRYYKFIVLLLILCFVSGYTCFDTYAAEKGIMVKENEYAEDIPFSEAESDIVFCGKNGLMNDSQEEITDERYSDSSTSDGWMYKLDEEKRTVTLLRYTGGDTNITVPASLNINGISYIVILQGMNSEEEFSFPKETKSVTISDGVKAAEDISYLFNGYSSYKRESMNLAELDVSGLDTSSTKNMSGLFNHCSVTDLDVSTFDTKNVTNMSYMFNGCNNLKNLNMNGLNTANVEDMSYMFGECHNFNRLDVSSFDTVTVNDMSGMFSYCISLKKLDVANFDTQKVKNMSGMFNECRELSDLDLGSFDTSNVINMSAMFSGCSSLQSLNLRSFDTEDVELFDYMFSGCLSLRELDLSGFTVLDRVNLWMYGMFSDCTALQRIYARDGVDWSSFSSDIPMFENCVNLAGDISYDPSKTDGRYARTVNGYFTAEKDFSMTISETRVVLYMGHDESLNSVVLSVGLPEGYDDDDIVWGSSDETVAKVNGGLVSAVGSGTATIRAVTSDANYSAECKITVSNVCTDGFLCNDWIAEKDDEAKTVTLIVYVGSEKIVNIPSSLEINGTSYSVIIRGTNSLEERTFPTRTTDVIIESGVNAAVDISYFFYSGPGRRGDAYGTSNMKSIDLRGLNTSNTENMEGLFYECAVTKLDLKGLNTSKVVNMRAMFSQCCDLEEIDLSSFDTSSVTDMSWMFDNCYEIRRIDLRGFDTSSVRSMEGMFLDCNELLELKLGKFDTSNVTNMSGMFAGPKLTSIDLGWLNTSNVTDMSGMFCGCDAETISLNGIDTSKVTKMNSMFSQCYNLSSLSVDNLDTSNVTDMSYMFYGCEKMNEIDISSFEIAENTCVEFMFGDCSRLKKIYASEGTDWSNRATGYFPFNGCNALKGDIDYDPDKTGVEFAKVNGGYFSVKGNQATPKNEIESGDLPAGEEVPDGVWVGGLKKSYPYTGNAIKPDVRVYYQSRRLTEGLDYTLSYKKNRAVGTGASVTVKCKGDFKGSKTVNFAIEKNPLTTASFEENNLTAAYDGKKHNNIKPVLMMDGKKLKYSKKDFDYKYLDAAGQESECKEAGSYTVRMTAKSTSKGYSGSIDVPFTVTDKTAMSKVTVTASKKSLPYNGEKQIPTFTLKYNKKPLAAGSYTMVELDGDDYTAPGNHTVIFRGNGTDVLGSRRYTYKITGKKTLGNKLTAAAITASSLDTDGKVPYAYGGAKPKLKISYNGITLKEGRDYTLSYASNKTVGSQGTVTAKGKGNYTGSVPVNFTVSQRSLDSMLLTVADRAASNKADDYKKTMILFTDSDYTDQKLKAGKDYTAEFTVSSGNAKPAAGESVTVLIKAKEGGSYKGQATATFKIIERSKDISRAKVKVNGGKAYEYTGKAIMPAGNDLTITLDGKAVNTGDYEIAACYNNVKRSSSAVLIIRGKEGLSGMKAVKFKIGVSPLEKLWKGLIGG